MSTIKISKLKLVKGGEKLSIVFEDDGDCPAEEVKLCKNPCHPDLLGAVKGLSVHLAIMTEYIPEKNSHKNDEVEKFKVTGYSIGGKEGEEGIVITGYRITKYGRTITLNTPFARFDEDPKTRYILMDALEVAIENIEKETLLYLTEGKKAPEAQQEMDFGDQQADKAIESATGNKVVRMQIADPTGSGIPLADPDAMERVAEWSPEQTVTGGRKRRPQSAANPAGM